MKTFSSGHTFKKVVRVPYQRCPVAAVEMSLALDGGLPQLISGKVDTGAFRTMLTFETARQLGFDPRKDPQSTARVANGQQICYHVHPILVAISVPASSPISFYLEAAFSEEVRENLFGIDWLEHLCLTVDAEAVHFLRD